MSDLDKTQKMTNPELAKTVRIDPAELDAPASPPAEDPMRKTIVMNKPPEIDAMGWLVGDRGMNKGQIHHLGGERTMVGADRSSDIVLDDGSVSDQHTSIRFRDGGFTIADLDSTNGTTVNGESVVRGEISDGDRIGFGASEWVFKCVIFDQG